MTYDVFMDMGTTSKAVDYGRWTCEVSLTSVSRFWPHKAAATAVKGAIGDF